MEMTVQEKAIYLAGIVDGEGSITIYKHIRNAKKVDYGGFLVVTNTSKELILWLCNNFGGSWCIRQGNSLSKKEVLRWQLYGKDALFLVMKISRFLIIKRKTKNKKLKAFYLLQ